jgi:thiol-disulfide isomerase/thioredoxin
VTSRRARAAAARPRFVIGVIVVGLVIGTWFLADRLVSDSPSNPAPDVAFEGDLSEGGAVQELRLPLLRGEGVVDYASFAEDPLVINFFASWCPACIAEMPEFERVHRLLDGEVAFLGVSQSDAREASIRLAEQTGITYETAIDERGDLFRAFGAFGMPTTVFVRPGGEIADVWSGGLDTESLLRLVAEHFGVRA